MKAKHSEIYKHIEQKRYLLLQKLPRKNKRQATILNCDTKDHMIQDYTVDFRRIDLVDCITSEIVNEYPNVMKTGETK